jgi:hypothetical protein
VRRVIEITLVLLALVAVPLGVVLVARSQRSQNAAPAALVRARQILGTAAVGGSQVRLSHCMRSADGSRISCVATGAGTGVCTFTAEGGGSCHGSDGSTSWLLMFGSDHRP